jgi:uncharacterized membrane protein
VTPAYDGVVHRLSDRRVATIFSLVLASGLCVSLLAVRSWYGGTEGYRFLVWNLVLAWIPFLLALLVYDRLRRGFGGVTGLLLGGLWLLFLPNAPYMVTDLVHLGRIPGAPLWFDGAMIAAFASTGLLLGLGSVFLLHAVAIRRLGSLVAWLGLLPVFALCSVGVVLGRFERLNSWDALVDPSKLVRALGPHLADPGASRRAIAAATAYTVFLVIAYLVLYTVSNLRADLDRESR